MTRKELVELLILIESIYPDFVTKSETINFCLEICGELDYEIVREKVHAHIRKFPFPPTITERKENGKETNRQMPHWMLDYTTRKSPQI